MMTARAQQKKPETTVEWIDVDQDLEREAWLQLRLGIVTASVMKDVMAGRDQDEQRMRKKLLYRLAGERLSGELAEDYANEYMSRGKRMEPEAREFYAFTRNVELEHGGFFRMTMPRGQVVGASPDARIVGQNGGLEVKTMKPELLIALAERGTFPSEHRAQCHGTMWVTGWDFVDLEVFYRGFPVKPTFRVERDDVYIREISDAVEVFEFDLRKLVEKINNMRGR